MGDLKEIKNKPNKAVIEIIMDLLSEAKKGNLQTIAVVADKNDAIYNVFYIPSNGVSILGGLRILERDVIDCSANIRKDVSWDFCE